MAKKRKHSEANAAEQPKKDSEAPERPKRTLLGWKDPVPTDAKETEYASSIFRNKEKVLVTCSRRINYRSSFFPHLLILFPRLLFSYNTSIQFTGLLWLLSF